MDKIIEFINKKTNNKYFSLSFKEATYNKKNNTIQLLFNLPKSCQIADNFDDLELLCKQYMADFNLKISCKIKKVTISHEELKLKCLGIVNELCFEHMFLINDLELIYDGKDTLLNIVDRFDIRLFDKEKYIKEIESEILNRLNIEVKVCFKESELHNTNEILKREEKILEENIISQSQLAQEPLRLIDKQNILGEITEEYIEPIGDLGGKGEIVFCGTLQNFCVRETKQKFIEKPEEELNEEKRAFTPKTYLSFDLVYEQKNVHCMCFLPKDTEPIMLKNDQTYVVKGAISQFNDTFSVRVKAIAECNIVAPKIRWKNCPKQYNYVKPEKYIQTEQVGLFFVDETTKNRYLLDNSFVVYDLETTGINLSYDKIIDIGAYKIVNGKITDKFCTFVNPEMPIPADASKVNRITDEMVLKYPNIDKILPDFYKFCYGSIIVGYNNIGFDDVFINREGRRLRYNFDNKRDDVFAIARKNLPGLKNYKLSTVCANQNVSLIDAHRAANDALATAKLFIKLAEKFC